jgi:hypothetical protein
MQGRETQAGDAEHLIGWKTWISREERLARSGSSEIFKHRPLLAGFMDQQRLSEQPAYAPAPCHLRGGSRRDWQNFMSGSDPLVGYNPRWAAARSRRPAPFSEMRQRSSSAIALERALTPLEIKPVDRSALAARMRAPQKPRTPVARVVSMDDLAPEVEERRRKGQTEASMHDSSIRSIMLQH